MTQSKIINSSTRQQMTNGERNTVHYTMKVKKKGYYREIVKRKKLPYQVCNTRVRVRMDGV